MIDPEILEDLQRKIRERVLAERSSLDALRKELRAGLGETREIRARHTTAFSLVGTDGGNNRVSFDPFVVQLIRVVDSSNNQYFLDVVTKKTDIAALSQRHLSQNTALGKMMRCLGVRSLWELSPIIKQPPNQSSPRWMEVYRELTEWAVLLDLVQNKEYGTDTVIVWDGLLRSTVFRGLLFKKFRDEVYRAILAHRARRRKVYVVGVAKHSKVLQRYRMAMALEGSMRREYPCYASVSRELEELSYHYPEYAWGDDVSDGKINKQVAGKMFFVKFGARPTDPIWPVDILEPQAEDAGIILGSLLNDAIEGFPVPFYPRCLQRAHENAALINFDMDILQQCIIKATREMLGEEAPLLDELQLLDKDPAARRYGREMSTTAL